MDTGEQRAAFICAENEWMDVKRGPLGVARPAGTHAHTALAFLVFPMPVGRSPQRYVTLFGDRDGALDALRAPRDRRDVMS